MIILPEGGGGGEGRPRDSRDLMICTKFVMAGEIVEKYLIFKIYRDQKHSCDS